MVLAMPYSEFTLRKAKRDFGLTTVEAGRFLPPTEPIAPSVYLTESLIEGLPLATATGSEKARSELIISPILVEITADYAASSLEGIKEVFEIVNQRLAGGKMYLGGDTISAADITFAALAAPLLLPPEHPVMVSKIVELPIKMAAVIKELQSTTAGVFALRLYREQRQVQ
jgi:Glutathione S-transferase, C-terminal domain